jgi:hypothetical protein
VRGATLWGKGQVANKTSADAKPQDGQHKAGRRGEGQVASTTLADAKTPGLEKGNRQLYAGVEEAMQLRRLEEERMLTVALRHLVRHRDVRGASIAFPTPRAVDRITLKAAALPTDKGVLEALVQRVFERRGEVLDLEEVYEDFVRAHGRLLTDLGKPWPESYKLVRF